MTLEEIKILIDKKEKEKEIIINEINELKKKLECDNKMYSLSEKLDIWC